MTLPAQALAAGFFAFDDRCVLFNVNPEAARLLGYAREELLNQPVTALLTKSAGIFFQTNVYPALAQNGRLEEAYVSLRAKDGAELPVLMNAQRAEASGTIQNHVVFLPMRRRQLFERELIASREAAERARQAELAALERIGAMQTKLALQERLATLGSLVAGVIHELNNPILYASSNLELLEELLADVAAATPADDPRELIRDAREGVEQIAALVRSLRTYARNEQEQQPVPVDLGRVIASSVRMTAHAIKQRARVNVDLKATSAVVLADETRLNQVLINLLLNAAQAFPRAAPEQNDIWVRLNLDAQAHAVVRVEDNGPGIPAELQSRIFEPFFTTKPVGQGTGLGLAICRDIVTSLGGDLCLCGPCAHGACFQMRLRVADAQRSRA